MTVEPSYWIDRQTPTSPDTYGVVEFEEGQPYEHVGVLVPDGRLQAIADAWDAASTSRHGGFAVRLSHPELAALLNALTEEDNDEQPI